MLIEPGIPLGQSNAQVPPFSISGNPVITPVHSHVSPTLVEPDKMLSQVRQAPAPSSTKSPGHSQVFSGPKDNRGKILAQSGMQAPVPSLISPSGHTSGTQTLKPLSISPFRHLHLPSTKVDPVKMLSQLSVQVTPSGQTQVSAFPSKLDPDKKLQLGLHLAPVGPDPGRPEVSRF